MNRNLDNVRTSAITEDAFDRLRTIDAIAQEFQRVNDREPRELVECVVGLLRDAGYRSVPKIDDTALGVAMANAMLDRIGWERAGVGKKPIETTAPGHDASLDVRPGSKSPGDAVRDYMAGMMDDLRARGIVLAEGSSLALHAQRAAAHAQVQDIIERNARGWQEGETDDERARR